MARIGKIGGSSRSHFCSNTVKTSRYSWYSFVPLNLAEQFRRVANSFFLLEGILMWIGWYHPSIFQSPFNPWSTMGTLLFVLSVTLLKDGIEDIARHKADWQENARQVTTMRDCVEKRVSCQSLRVGEWVKVHNGEQVPADMVAIEASNEDNELFVETSNIDGETSLKLRHCVNGYHKVTDPDSCLASLNDMFECEDPNKHVSSFICTITTSVGRKLVATTDNLLLRGSIVRNTNWVYGFVVYTGKDTKIMQNMHKVPAKLSSIERTTNRTLIFVFCMQLVFVVVSVILCSWVKGEGSGSGYGGKSSDTTLPFWFAQGLTFFLLYCNMIPISLYVTIEMVNVAQAHFVNNDKEMMCTDGHDCEEVQIPSECRESKLCQEIGQIEYVFSDKTGTLTKNVMEFKQCSTRTAVYASMEAMEIGKNDPQLQQLLRIMALCHTVYPRHVDASSQDAGDIRLSIDKLERRVRYEGQSPDECALVRAASSLGVSLVQRDNPHIQILLSSGQRETFEVLAINHFTSTRKRMSVILKNQKDQIILLCKGADSVMFSICSELEDEKNVLEQHVSRFAKSGYRTLVAASKTVSQEEFLVWASKFSTISTQTEGRNDKLDDLATEIEQDLTFVGTMAIEDELQEGVPETIRQIVEAGIKLWVMTGDKMETAISVGYSSGILAEDMDIIRIDWLGSESDLQERLENVIVDLNLHSKLERNLEREESKLHSFLKFLKSKIHRQCTSALEPLSTREDGSEQMNSLTRSLLDSHDEDLAENGSVSTRSISSKKDRALIIRGEAFKHVTSSQHNTELLVTISKACKTVIACRVIPSQKAEFVKLFGHSKTLAIGDGANDVSMIRQANVGVGIKGKEGREAVNSADFAIGQFRFLSRLLLVHGRWNYTRMSKVILLSFYKNFALVLSLFFFNVFALMSGVSMYDSFMTAGFNFFTGMPLLLIGVFDQDLSDSTMMKLPWFYRKRRGNASLSTKTTILWVLRSLNTAIVVTILPLVSYAFDLGVPATGESNLTGLQAYGTLIFTSLLFAVMYVIAIETHTWNVVNMFFFIGSFVFYFCVTVLLSNLATFYPVFFGVAENCFKSMYFWMQSIEVSLIVLVLEMCFRVIHVVDPTIVDIAIELDRGYIQHCSIDRLRQFK